MTLLFSYSHSLPTPSNSSSQALHQQTVPPDSHSWPRSGSLFFLYVVREHRYSTARWASWRWDLCWAMDAPRAPSGSRKASWAARCLSAVAHSSGLRLIIPCFGSWSYSSVLLSIGIYNKPSKSLKKEGSRDTSPSPGNCLSQFFTNEQLVSVTHWWGHTKYPLWTCCLQQLALSIGRDSARCLT